MWASFGCWFIVVVMCRCSQLLILRACAMRRLLVHCLINVLRILCAMRILIWPHLFPRLTIQWFQQWFSELERHWGKLLLTGNWLYSGIIYELVIWSGGDHLSIAELHLWSVNAKNGGPVGYVWCHIDYLFWYLRFMHCSTFFRSLRETFVF